MYIVTDFLFPCSSLTQGKIEALEYSSVCRSLQNVSTYQSLGAKNKGENILKKLLNEHKYAEC
jgi:hypothetical protein